MLCISNTEYRSAWANRSLKYFIRMYGLLRPEDLDVGEPLILANEDAEEDLQRRAYNRTAFC